MFHQQKNININYPYEKNKRYIVFLWGIVDFAFSRGDSEYSPLYIQYAVIKSEVYIGGKKVAYIDSLDQIYYKSDEEGIIYN